MFIQHEWPQRCVDIPAVNPDDLVNRGQRGHLVGYDGSHLNTTISEHPGHRPDILCPAATHVAVRPVTEGILARTPASIAYPTDDNDVQFLYRHQLMDERLRRRSLANGMRI